MVLKVCASSAVLLLVASVASAQDDARRPSPGNPESHKASRPSGPSLLQRRYGLSAQEAQERQAILAEFEQQIAQAQSRLGENLIASIIDHQPNFRLTLVVDNDLTVQDVRSGFSPQVQRFIAVRKSKYAGPQIQARQREILDLFIAQDVEAVVSYNYRTDKFDVRVDTERAIPDLLALIPAALRSDVKLERGGVGLLQTGYRAGDGVWGGWALENNARNVCTAGYVLENTTERTRHISTAGHCPSPLSVYTNQHVVTFGTPRIDKNPVPADTTSNGRTYDYRIYATGQLDTGPWVWYLNNVTGTYQIMVAAGQYETRTWANVNPDLEQNGGYIRVVGVVKGGSAGGLNPTHPTGAERCKNGFRTGVTCGTISTSSAAFSVQVEEGVYRTYYGVVEVTTQDYMVIAYGGDSGGPVFTFPAWNASTATFDASAAGVTVAGNDRYRRPCITNQDSGCHLIYMPIDRINDHGPYNVVTTAGVIAP